MIFLVEMVNEATKRKVDKISMIYKSELMGILCFLCVLISQRLLRSIYTCVLSKTTVLASFKKERGWIFCLAHQMRELWVEFTSLSAWQYDGIKVWLPSKPWGYFGCSGHHAIYNDFFTTTKTVGILMVAIGTIEILWFSWQPHR